MGSAKHIRNNGEQINIHGHDNYQMPGAYKQMGDKNQNQSLGAYKLVEDQEMMQPSKISGGAAKYIKESYGVDKIDDPDPPVKNPKTINELPSYTKKSYTGSTSSTGGGGETSSKKSTNNLSNYQSTLVDKGSNFKPTKAQTAEANAKVASLKKLDQNNAAFNSKNNQGSTSQTNNSSIEKIKLGNQTRAQIETGGQTKISNRIEVTKAKKAATIAQAAIDSTKKSNQEYDRIGKAFGQNQFQKQRTHDYIANTANKAARTTMAQSKLFTQDQIRKNFSFKPKLNENKPGISGNIDSASNYGGPNKGIHSSKSKGLNKILGDLDNSGDLSKYEKTRQAAIEENMSTGSTKKRYKH